MRFTEQHTNLSQVENWRLAPDEQTRFGTRLANGKACLVQVDIWEDMMIRSKRGKNMKDKPFRLVSIQLLDADTEKPIFKKRMWLGVWGDRRKELSAEEIYWAYRQRFDVEHFFRFGKQRLLLDKFQTPDEEHLQNWLEIVSLAYWLLWVARPQATDQCRKWQKYDKNFKKRCKMDLGATPSQVQQQLDGIILSFEQSPFFPKGQKNGIGRKQGDQQAKRKKYPIKKKKKKQKKQKNK